VTGGAGEVAGADEDDVRDVVDVHGHGVPAALLEDIRSGRVSCPGVAVSHSDGRSLLSFDGTPGPLAISAELLDFDRRLGWLDDRAIDTQLVSPWLDVQGSTLPADAGQRWTGLLNDHLAEQVRDSGGRLHALASVHLGDPSRAAAELRRAITELGLCGLVLSTDPVPAELSADEVDELWAAAADLDVPVILHPDVCGPASGIYAHDDIGHINAFARVFDSTLLAVRLVQAGVLDRHPALRLVLVHGGGFLPFQVGRVQRALDIESLGPNHARERDLAHYLRRFYYDTVLLSRGAVELLVEEYGADHVVLGSDYPFAIGDPDPVGTVTRTRIPIEDKARILGANAHGLFGPLPAAVAR
jgi:aminocarboxymuconate-semialdehyde decarboxylase